jgi:ecotropic viral integration site 5 protein
LGSINVTDRGFLTRFPLPIVYRIFDHLFATGVEAIFGFSIALLQSNEEKLLEFRFDSILDYIKSALFDAYLVRFLNLSLEET